MGSRDECWNEDEWGRGLDKLPTPHLCQRPVFSNAGEFSAKQKPSLQFIITAKHKAQLENTQTTKYVKVSILEPKETATFGPLDAAWG